MTRPPLRIAAFTVVMLALSACGGGSSGSDSGAANALAPTNSPPVIEGAPPQTARVGLAYRFRPTARDADGDGLTFGVLNAPEWASFNPGTGELSGTPPASSKPAYAGIEVSVSDGKATSVLPRFDLTVEPAPEPPPPVNNPPAISGTPETLLAAGSPYEFVPAASDPDGQPLLFSVANKPGWAQFDTATGRLSGAPADGDAGLYPDIVISVSDGSASSALPGFDIQVMSVTALLGNRAPVISGVPATTVQAGAVYDFRPTASDPDGQPLTFGIANKPPWASFSTTNGRLTGTPADREVGTYANIVISVSDGTATARLAAFTITVTAPANRAPTISGTPGTSVKVGRAYAFVPAASDPDGQALTFGVANKPSWASFSVATGRLAGTPSSADVGSYPNIVISVTDGTAKASLAAFTITVTGEANRAPVISGTPATSVEVGQAYAFVPTASDPDGQPLAFGIANKPAWASFDTATGALTGTPTSADVGSYSNIVISVSDGADSATLPAFTLSVSAPAAGFADLAWTAPVEDTNGRPLANLAGFKVHYGNSAVAMNRILDVPDPKATRVRIGGLAAGTWFFAVTAYTTSGTESGFSNVGSKTIN